MANSSQDYSSQIRAQLKLTDPDLSADPLTPERKIIDSVAEQLASIQSDQNVLQYQFDIDTKVGSDLDKFVALFGFARQGGNKATGVVTFSSNLPVTQDTYIPVGTLISTQGSSVGPAVQFITTNTTVIYANTSSADATVECVNVGLSGNVPANTIGILNSSSIGNASFVNNAVATSGGTELETDTELRLRFKNTIFRNIAGTKDQFLAIAIASQYCDRARVISPIDRYVEYVQIPNNLTITSTIPYSKFTYNFDYYITQNSLGGEIFFQQGMDYSFTASVPPQIIILKPDSTRNFNIGSVILLEHSYNSVNSRNDPTNNLTNYIDVYVSGNYGITATDSVYFPTASGTVATTFTVASGSPYFTGNYRRYNTRTPVQSGNIYQRLLWQPITALPSSITVNGNTFYNNSDYFLVEDTTVQKGSKRARNGIEWGFKALNTITSGTNYQVSYTYNKLIVTLNQLMDAHKQIATDVLVHAAIPRYFNVTLTIIYLPGFSQSSVDISISNSLSTFFNSKQFGDVIQISDILQLAHEVSGVDSVRLALSQDGSTYGIQEIAPDGVTGIGQPYTSDFFLLDSDIPILNQLITIRRSQNTY